ncbi:Hypothetical protein, putative [Bodo saltans]|uniref:Uncharacterized protein n=1 Tax=Bodo saltans TaxID=75058 RepID=A0A0S4JDC4_BODSA|nr:Hypothetical protein, putative [Bodo saltans]|eukprot:CUG88038.1 Hypothetical protein, putative [Bodo saltans]
MNLRTGLGPLSTHLARRITLVTSFFSVKRIPGALSLSTCNLENDEDPQTRAAKAFRQQEYLDCLKYNLASDSVEKLILLVEGRHSFDLLHSEVLSRSATSFGGGITDAQRKKLVPMLIHKQPTYAELFQAATKLSFAPQKLSGVVDCGRSLWMVCNADIHLPQVAPKENFDVEKLHQLFTRFHDSQQRLSDGRKQHERLVLAMSRHESESNPGGVIDAPLILDYRGSHDAFIFEPPMPQPFLGAVGHPQNCYKSENIVIHALQQQARALVLNPCLDLKIIHRHAADVRQWLPPVDEERYARVEPTSLDDALAQF